MTAARRRTLAVAVAVLAVVVATSSVAATNGSTSVRPATSVAGDEPRFVGAAYSEHHGDVARIPVALPNWSVATVTIDAADGDYAATVVLADRDGDGRVTLRWNTYAVGRSNETTFASNGADSATLRDGASTSPAPGSYDLRVSPGRNSTAATDRSTVRLTPPGPLSVDVLRADGDRFDELTVPGAFRRSDLVAPPPRPTIHGVRRPTLLAGDVVVLRVRAPGLAGALAVTDGPNATARFGHLVGRQLELRIDEDPSTVNAEEDPDRLRFGDFVERRVVADPAADTYYVVLDASAPVDPADPTNEFPGNEEDAFVVRVGPTSNSSLAGRDREPATEVFRFAEPFATLDGPSLRVGRLGTVSVDGTALVPPGSEVVVVVHSNATGLRVDRRVTVSPDGRFGPSVDLSSLSRGDRVDVIVRGGNTTLARTRVRVREWAIVRSPLGDPIPFEPPLEAVRVDVNTSSGGFVVVGHWSSAPVLGHSTYLPPGTHRDVRVPLDEPVTTGETLFVTVHRDADGDRSFDADADPQYGAGSPWVGIRYEVDAATPSATATPVTDLATTTSPPATAAADGNPSSGPVPVLGGGSAVVAVLVAVLLWRVWDFGR